MKTRTIKIKKEAGNSARSANRIGRSSVKSEGLTAKKVFGNNGAISAYGPARSTIKGTPLKPDELEKIDAYWQASLYLCLGMHFRSSFHGRCPLAPSGADVFVDFLL